MTKKTKKDESLERSCGIVMPIAEIDGCSSSHWVDVREIIVEAAKTAGFEARLVSESDDIGVIQQRIVQNLYDCDIVVCDVSAKNANVMFELGLRLAFDKPAIVLKDDQTSYSFDTSPIEHLEYPRDLRYSEIQKFKTKLSKKITATLEASKKPDYTTFLKHFGKFKVAGLDTKEISEQEYLVQEFRTIKDQISRLSASVGAQEISSSGTRKRVGVPIRILSNLIKRGVEAGELNVSELEKVPEVAFSFIYNSRPTYVDKYSSPKDFERAVLRAVDLVLTS